MVSVALSVAHVQLRLFRIGWLDRLYRVWPIENITGFQFPVRLMTAAVRECGGFGDRLIRENYPYAV